MSTTPHPDAPTAAEAFADLRAGNARFAEGIPRHGHYVAAAVRHVDAQSPVAAVFSCIDSRVTAEALFDQDFGRLIVVRTAGHVPDRAALESLEFAVTELAVPLVVVLGHTRCGAVALGVDIARRGEAPTEGPMTYLAERLYEPARRALDEEPDRPHDAALRRQVAATVAELRDVEHLKGATIVGGWYDIATGEVVFADDAQAG